MGAIGKLLWLLAAFIIAIIVAVSKGPALIAAFRRSPLRASAISTLVLLHIVIPLGLTFDCLFWWREYTPFEFVAMSFLFLLVCNGFFWSFVELMFWTWILRHLKTSSGLPWHRSCVFVIVCADLVASAFIVTTNIASVRSTQANGGRLTGFLVPGGHAMFTADPGVPSINNSYAGRLLVKWRTSDGTETAADTYQISGGRSSKHVMTEAETVLHRIMKLPEYDPGGVEMAWTCTGRTTVFADRGGPKHIEAWGPGGGKRTVFVDGQSFAVSGVVRLPSFGRSGVLRRLVRMKEYHRLSVWAASTSLLFLSYGCLMWARILTGPLHAMTKREAAQFSGLIEATKGAVAAEGRKHLASLLGRLADTGPLFFGTYKGYQVFSDRRFVEFADELPEQILKLRGLFSQELPLEAIEKSIPADIEGRGERVVSREVSGARCILSSQSCRVAVDPTYLDYLMERYPKAKVLCFGATEPVVLFDRHVVRALLMPIKPDKA